MKVFIDHERGLNPVIQNAIYGALENKIPISFNFGYVVFSCDEWDKFLKIMWHGFSVASKSCHGWAMRRKYKVVIVTDKGNRFVTRLWIDENRRGLHYVSLD